MPEKINEKFEAAMDIKKEYLQDFEKFRNDYLDELPPKRLMPGDKDYYLYKCRGNFFVGVANRINRLIQKGVLTNPESIKEGNEFIEYVRNRDFEKYSTQPDIDRVNEILDFMIKELS
jgi:hypothetical protein